MQRFLLNGFACAFSAQALFGASGFALQMNGTHSGYVQTIERIATFTQEFFMPLVRISLPYNTTAADVAAVSSAIHQALVATFNVPEPDLFQAIHRHNPEELVCTPEFLGIAHSQHAVFVQISCSPGRTAELKKALYARISTDIALGSSFAANDVIINLLETNRENWSFGQGIAQYVL
jgi:4-oxalocrotonate tautomerase